MYQSIRISLLFFITPFILAGQSEQFEGIIFYQLTHGEHEDKEGKLKATFNCHFKESNYRLDLTSYGNDSIGVGSLIAQFDSDTSKYYNTFAYCGFELTDVLDPTNSKPLDLLNEGEFVTTSIDSSFTDTIMWNGYVGRKLRIQKDYYGSKMPLTVIREVYLSDKLKFNVPKYTNYNNAILSVYFKGRIPIKIIERQLVGSMEIVRIYSPVHIIEGTLPQAIFNPGLK